MVPAFYAPVGRARYAQSSAYTDEGAALRSRETAIVVLGCGLT
ncbi:MAG: hypothetical protein AB1627_07475 [Chloroflexota bacterium]